MNDKLLTRAQIAKAVGVNPRTIDRYVHEGLISGQFKYVDGRGNMRLFSPSEVKAAKEIHENNLLNLKPGLRRYIDGPITEPITGTETDTGLPTGSPDSQ